MKALIIFTFLALVCFTGYHFTRAVTRARFKKLFILIVGSFLFTGCLTVSKIKKNCDQFAAVCITESKTTTITETVYRDTVIILTDTVAIILPPDTVTITDTVTIKNNKAYLAPVFREFGLIGVNAFINNSVLNVAAWLTDSTILQPRIDTVIIENAIKEQNTTTTTEQTATAIKKHVPKFYKFTAWVFAILVFGLVLYAVAKLKEWTITGTIKKLKDKI